MYLKSDTSLLADVFENFRDLCLEIYQLDLAELFSTPRLAWQVDFKKTKIKLELLTNIDMQLMVEEEIRGELCHSINRYVKAYNKYMESYDKSKGSSILNIGITIICKVVQCHTNCLQMT